MFLTHFLGFTQVSQVVTSGGQCGGWLPFKCIAWLLLCLFNRVASSKKNTSFLGGKIEKKMSDVFLMSNERAFTSIGDLSHIGRKILKRLSRLMRARTRLSFFSYLSFSFLSEDFKGSRTSDHSKSCGLRSGHRSSPVPRWWKGKSVTKTCVCCSTFPPTKLSHELGSSDAPSCLVHLNRRPGRFPFDQFVTTVQRVDLMGERTGREEKWVQSRCSFGGFPRSVVWTEVFFWFLLEEIFGENAVILHTPGAGLEGNQLLLQKKNIT